MLFTISVTKVFNDIHQSDNRLLLLCLQSQQGDLRPQSLTLFLFFLKYPYIIDMVSCRQCRFIYTLSSTPVSTPGQI